MWSNGGKLCAAGHLIMLNNFHHDKHCLKIMLQGGHSFFRKNPSTFQYILPKQQVKLMWTPEALSLFMINHPYLDSLNDVEIYNALKN